MEGATADKNVSSLTSSGASPNIYILIYLFEIQNYIVSDASTQLLKQRDMETTQRKYLGSFYSWKAYVSHQSFSPLSEQSNYTIRIKQEKRAKSQKSK